MTPINFSRKIYSRQAIEKAMEDFQNLARFYLEEKEDYYVVSMKDIDPEVQDSIRDEFCNYVIYIMI